MTIDTEKTEGATVTYRGPAHAHACLFRDVAKIVSSELEIDALVQVTLELLVKTFNAGAGALHLFHPETGKVHLYVSDQDGNRAPREISYRPGEGFLGWVAEKREPLLVNDTTHDLRSAPVLESEFVSPVRSLVVVPLVWRDNLYGVLELINKVEGDFTSEDRDTLGALADQIGIAFRNASLYEKLKKESLQRERLFEIGKYLSSSLELDEVLEKILDALHQVVPYSVAGIFLVDRKSQTVNTFHTRGYDPALAADLRLKIGQGLVGYVAKTGEPVIVPDVAVDPRYINAHSETQSEMVAPIVAGGKVIGVFNLEANRKAAFSPADLELLNAFAGQAALTIERARLYREILGKKRLEDELKIARQIQVSFLPTKNPTVRGFDIAGLNISSQQVGGDYYDFIPIVEGQMGIAIADSIGKGIPAALVMASFRASLLAEIRNNYAIRTILGKVNRLLWESLEQGNFVTAVYGVLDTQNRILTYSNAGHNQPILRRASGKIDYLAEGGMALAISPDAAYAERRFTLRAGDILVFYTDGVTEAKNERNEEFGQGRLEALLHQPPNLSAEALAHKIVDEVKMFAAPTHQMDDLTLVVVRA